MYLNSIPFQTSLLNHDTIVGAYNEGGGHWVLIVSKLILFLSVCFSNNNKLEFVNYKKYLCTKTLTIHFNWRKLKPESFII